MPTKSRNSKQRANRARSAGSLDGVVKHPVVIAYDKYREANPQIFDCTTLNMHPAHHRYLANRLQDAFESGWKAREDA